MIRIRAKRERGFRRCGMRHGKEWTEHPDGAFSEEQLAVLQAEPMLEVQVVEEKADSGEDGLFDPESLESAARLAASEGKVTSDGRPEVKALEKLLGRNVSAAERDAVWEKIQVEE